MAKSPAINSRATVPNRGDVRRRAVAPAGLDDLAAVVATVGAEGDPVIARHSLDERSGRLDFGPPGRLVQLEVHQQAVAVLHQGVPGVAELGLSTLALACQLGLGIRRGFVGLVAALGASKVTPTVVVRAIVIVVRGLRAEALHRRPRLDQGAIHREVLVARELALAGLVDDCPKQRAGHVVLQQPLAVVAEGCPVPNLLRHVHVEKPAVQQVVAKLFAELTVAADAVQRH